MFGNYLGTLALILAYDNAKSDESYWVTLLLCITACIMYALARPQSAAKD